MFIGACFPFRFAFCAECPAVARVKMGPAGGGWTASSVGGPPPGSCLCSASRKVQLVPSGHARSQRNRPPVSATGKPAGDVCLSSNSPFWGFSALPSPTITQDLVLKETPDAWWFCFPGRALTRWHLRSIVKHKGRPEPCTLDAFCRGQARRPALLLVLAA